MLDIRLYRRLGRGVEDVEDMEDMEEGVPIDAGPSPILPPRHAPKPPPPPAQQEQPHRDAAKPTPIVDHNFNAPWEQPTALPDTGIPAGDFTSHKPISSSETFHSRGLPDPTHTPRTIHCIVLLVLAGAAFLALTNPAITANPILVGVLLTVAFAQLWAFHSTVTQNPTGALWGALLALVWLGAATIVVSVLSLEHNIHWAVPASLFVLGGIQLLSGTTLTSRSAPR